MTETADSLSEGMATAVEVAAPEPEPVEPAVAEQPGSLGARLKQAREASGMSIADVVQVIRFSAHQIEALERDEFDTLPGATSVRGLVRNYAKLLKLDPVPLLALLDPVVPVPEADVRPPANMGEAEQLALGERVPSSLLMATGMVLVVALGGFWYLDSQREPAASTPVLAPAPAAVALPQPVAEAQTAVPPATAVAVGSPDTPASVAAPLPAAGLRLEFDDLSWVEVRDANQKVVLVGEYPAGSRHNVDGKAPFQIWIGKASGVRVFMGDRSIDLKPHTREEVARFTLD